MADAMKRMNKTNDKAFQDRCEYYMYQKAGSIFPGPITITVQHGDQQD